MKDYCDHIGLFTDNLEELKHFYIDKLGFEFIKEETISESIVLPVFDIQQSCVLVKLTRGNVSLELFKPVKGLLDKKSDCTEGYNHWGLKVDNKHLFCQELENKGVPVITITRNDRTIYFVKDPDKNRIEIRE